MTQQYLIKQHDLRILVAEGNLEDQQTTLSQLQQLGYTADTVEDGIEVLSALQYISYDVVFMDVHMPYMDGIATSQAIKTACNPISPWIVAMATQVLLRDLHRMLNAGMDDYLVKPIELSALHNALMRCQSHNQSLENVTVSNIVLSSESSLAINPTLVSESTLEPIEASKAVAIAPLDSWALQQVLQMVTHDPAGFFVTTIDFYLSEARQLLEHIHLAIRERDAVKLGRSAHTLKSSSATLGALDFAQLCQALENLERSQSLADVDWEQAVRQVAKLEQDYPTIEEALQIERQKYQ
jgi:CheY-like chemotaxis protein